MQAQPVNTNQRRALQIDILEGRESFLHVCHHPTSLPLGSDLLPKYGILMERAESTIHPEKRTWYWLRSLDGKRRIRPKFSIVYQSELTDSYKEKTIYFIKGKKGKILVAIVYYCKDSNFRSIEFKETHKKLVINFTHGEVTFVTRSK